MYTSLSAILHNPEEFVKPGAIQFNKANILA